MNESKGGESYLQKHGTKVAANGWPLVILGHKSKKPFVKDWQTRPPYSVAQVRSLIKSGKRYGIGIRCGNIVGLDDDYELGGVVTEDFLKAIAELKAHFFPKTLQRMGRPSRPPLMVFRLKDDEVYRSLNIAKFQILGKGRQFVAYNIHPETGEPYRWLKAGVGTPASMPLDKIPTYERKHLDNFIKAVEVLEDAWGLGSETGVGALERIKDGDYTPAELEGDRRTLERAAEFVENPESWGWDEWNRNVMMPLWSASKGEDWGLEIAHKISSKHPMYDKDVTDERWEALTRSPPSRIGAGTIIWQARQNGMPYLGPSSWNDYKVFLDREEILDSKSQMWVSRTMFNDLFVKHKSKGLNPIQTFIDSRSEQVFHTVTWDPELPAGEAITGERRYWNTCVLPTDYYEDGNIEPFLELMHNLYGKDADVIEKRMAFDVQFPHKKPQWHELIISDHGYGKNLSKTPLRNWFGDMAETLNAKVLDSSFQTFMVNKKHIEIVELASIDNKIFNRHKDLLSTTDPWYTVNEKHRRPYRVKNVVSAWMSSNEVDALSLSPTERRVFVVFKRDKSLGKRRLRQIHEWMKTGWKHVIHHLKHNVKVAEDYCDLLPRRTEAMMELIQITGRTHDKLRTIVREATRDCIMFSISELHQHLIEAGVSERPGQMVFKETLLKTLMAEGAVRVCEGEQVRIDGERHRLWSFDQSLSRATPNMVRTLWTINDKLKPINID